MYFRYAWRIPTQQGLSHPCRGCLHGLIALPGAASSFRVSYECTLTHTFLYLVELLSFCNLNDTNVSKCSNESLIPKDDP